MYGLDQSALTPLPHDGAALQLGVSTRSLARILAMQVSPTATQDRLQLGDENVVN